MTPPAIDVDSTRKFLKKVIPEWEWLIARIESRDGRLKMPPQLTTLIRNLKIDSYPQLYLNEHAPGLMMLSALYTPEELKGLSDQAASASPEERGEWLHAELGEVPRWGEAVFSLHKTPAEEQAGHAQWNSLSPEEQSECTVFLQRVWMAYLAMFHQCMSVMVHGEKLSSLVAQAQAGNDEAFAKAVQIDNRVLHQLPYFKNRWDRACTEDERDFKDLVGRKLGSAPYKGKIRHKGLWLTFAILELNGLLDSFSHRDMLDLCDEIGVGGHKNRIEDVKNLTKRLAEYKRFQKRGVVSTP